MKYHLERIKWLLGDMLDTLGFILLGCCEMLKDICQFATNIFSGCIDFYGKTLPLSLTLSIIAIILMYIVIVALDAHTSVEPLPRDLSEKTTEE